MHLVRLALADLVDIPVSTGSVDRGGRTLEWVEAGDGTPIVMVAGAGETVLTWASLFPQLVGRGRIVAYDRAGLGASEPIPRSTAQDAVEDLGAVVESVGPAIVVGHSWGGLLAEVLALTRPELVRGLVLIDPTHEGVFDTVPLRMRLAEAAMMRGIVVRHWLGRAAPIIHGMAADLAENCTTDEATRARIVAAYEASYSRRRSWPRSAGRIGSPAGAAPGCVRSGRRRTFRAFPSRCWLPGRSHSPSDRARTRELGTASQRFSASRQPMQLV